MNKNRIHLRLDDEQVVASLTQDARADGRSPTRQVLHILQRRYGLVPEAAQPATPAPASTAPLREAV